MKITAITLYTSCLEQEKEFYTRTLGLQLIRASENAFTVQVGWTALEFRAADTPHHYHYCFLIPVNQLQEALVWMQQRVPVLDTEPGEKIVNFETWNAESFYFYDASGNLAECIVRHDLHNASQEPFGPDSFLGLNEIGLPVQDIPAAQTLLAAHIGSQAWKGDTERFGTHGTEEGIFLLPDFRVKTTWFPVMSPIRPWPVRVQVHHAGKAFALEYADAAFTFLPDPIRI